MKKFIKNGLITLAVNILLCGILIFIANRVDDSGNMDNLSIGLFTILIYGLLLLLEFITGMILSITEKKKEIGQGLLLGFGLTILIAGVFCGGIYLSQA